MGAKGGGKVTVYDYHMSLHLGICAAGEGLELLNVKMGEKIVWEGRLRRNTVVGISRPNLFGGEKKEGGVRGLLWWLDGNPLQRLPQALASRMNRVAANCPGHRGYASIFLTGPTVSSGEDLDEFWPNFRNAMNTVVGGGPFSTLAAAIQAGLGRAAGFYLASNNPYLKAASARVRRAPVGLRPDRALIRLPDSSEGKQQYGANPAHMIFECMTNASWGMGASVSDFNIDSFEAAANTLWNEKFGLCMIWARSGEIETFVQEVLDHVQGALFIDPTNGRWTLRLLREAGSLGTLPQINPDNARIIGKPKRKTWGDIPTEVVVTWTNPETGEEETVTAQDAAATAAQGAPISTARNYHGVASQELAMKLAERDLAAVCYPSMSFDFEVTREFWRRGIYDLMEVSWPEFGVDRMICRVSKVTQTDSGRLRLSLTEDVFSVGRSSYLVPTASAWQNQSPAPAPLATTYLGTAPAFMAAAARELEDPGMIQSHQATALLLAVANTGADIDYELRTQAVNVLGQPRNLTLGLRNFNPSWLLADALPAQASSTITRGPTVSGQPEVGDFLMLGTTDAGSEICAIRSIGAGTLTIDRGLLDTTPKAWPAGTRIFVISPEETIADTTARATGEVAAFRLLPQTSRGRLAPSDAPEISATMTNRAFRPLRPANVRVGGVAFGTANMGAATSINVTWANRNRADESTVALLWTDGEVSGETDQTTVIQLLQSPSRTLITEITGLTGSSHTLPKSALANNSPVIVRVLSRRGGVSSLQAHEILLAATF